MVCVGLGALGVFLPGLPTTVFLIVASWCFARSCPWLEERMIRVPLFRPFLRYFDGGARMPLRAVVTTLVVMWAAIAVSTTLLIAGDDPRPLVAAIVLVAGLVGSVFVVRLRTTRAEKAPHRQAHDVVSPWPPGDRIAAGRG